MVTQALGAAVRLDLAGRLVERPRTVDELAQATGASADGLRRLVRALAGHGVFELREDTVHQTAMSELLRDGVPESAAAMVRLQTGLPYRAWGDSFESFRSGEPAVPRMTGLPMFDWYAEHAAEADLFNRAMAEGARFRRAAVLERDWSQLATVVDVGGGTGTMLTSLLLAQPHLRGTVLDLEHARDGAEAAIAAAGLEDRCRFEAGSFFESVPAGADVYLMSVVLHDWDDERAGTILRICRRAARPDSRLLLVENVIEATDSWSWPPWLDLQMLVLLAGRERTVEEWSTLLDASGWALTDADAERGLVDAVPV